MFKMFFYYFWLLIKPFLESGCAGLNNSELLVMALTTTAKMDKDHQR